MSTLSTYHLSPCGTDDARGSSAVADEERHLVQLAKDGVRGAFDQLVARDRSGFFQTARRYARCNEDAEDKHNPLKTSSPFLATESAFLSESGRPLKRGLRSLGVIQVAGADEGDRFVRAACIEKQ